MADRIIPLPVRRLRRAKWVDRFELVLGEVRHRRRGGTTRLAMDSSGSAGSGQQEAAQQFVQPATSTACRIGKHVGGFDAVAPEWIGGAPADLVSGADRTCTTYGSTVAAGAS